MKKLPLFLFIGAIGIAIYLVVYLDGGNVKIKTEKRPKTETRKVEKEPKVARSRKVHEFDKIQVDGIFEVVVTYGSKEKVEIEAPNKTRKEIKLKVQSGTLLVKLDRSTLRYAKGSKIHVYTEKLNDFALSGTASVKLNNTLKDSSFSIKTAGTASFTGELNVATAEIELAGASSVQLFGTATAANLDLSGASKLAGDDFNVHNLTVDMNGLSKATITCSQRLEGNLSGISKLSYAGSPNVKNMKISGSATSQKK
ncbi:MAG: head GIN domain-containing protein [Crocinitomicaceae bacterium]